MENAKLLAKLEQKLLHYVGKAIAHFGLIRNSDRIMVCLSGGKDSFTMLSLLKILSQKTNGKFSIFAFTLDQGQPGWDHQQMQLWLEEQEIPHTILYRDTYSIVTEKIPAGKTYCSLCSRLRRGNIYNYAKQHGFKKIALGHHRDDAIQTLLMSIFYNGDIRALPPKLLTDDKRHLVIRPLIYCQEQDIQKYAELKKFPIIPCNLCGSQENLARQRIKQLISELSKANPKIPSNMLHALSSLKPETLMDKDFCNFRDLDSQLITEEDLLPNNQDVELDSPLF